MGSGVPIDAFNDAIESGIGSMPQCFDCTMFIAIMAELTDAGYPKQADAGDAGAEGEGQPAAAPADDDAAK